VLFTDSISGKSVAVSAAGAGIPADAALSSEFITFPAELAGATVESQASLYNSSSTPLTIDEFQLAGTNQQDFGISQNGCVPGATIDAASSCQFQVSFSPSAPGARIAEIDVGYNASGSPLTVPLIAMGLRPSQQISFVPASVNLGAVKVRESIQTSAQISNAGTEPVSITQLSLTGANPSDYAITGNGCPQAPATLAAGTSCYVFIQFTPSALGTRLAYLQVTDNAAGNPQNLSLVGFGGDSPATLVVKPNPVIFNSEPLGSSTSVNVGLSALGDVPVTFGTVQMAGPNAADFTLANSCVGQQAACNINVAFTPSATGIRAADLQIQDNAAGNPQVVPLAGMGITSAPLSISFSPNLLAFPGVQGVGFSGTSTVNIFNNGTGPVVISGFHIGGPNAADFGIQSNNCPVSPAPLSKSPCTVTLVFTPQASGIRIANLSVTDNASGSPQSIAIVGEGAAPLKSLQVPSSLAFETVPVGESQFGWISILNIGTEPVTFTGFRLSGANAADYEISKNACQDLTVLDPDASCLVSIAFTPSATGARTAVLTIQSDAVGSPQTVALSGTGQ